MTLMRKQTMSLQQLSRVLGIALVFAFTSAQAKPPSLPELALSTDPQRSATTPLSQLKPSGRWVLLVLDANLASTEAFLRGLKRDQFDGAQTVLVLIGKTSNAQQLKAHLALPEKMLWTQGQTKAVLKTLAIGGTPAIYGVGPDNSVAWRQLGYGARPGDVLVRVWDWLKPSEPRASAQ
jgi:hypothetical protein